MATRARQDEAVRITTVAASRNADIAQRQKRYLLSMSLRSACFIGAVIVGPGLLCWFLIAGALVLPYVAVVMANAAATRTDDRLDLVSPGDLHPQLGAGPDRGPDRR
ncbi:DUF3099 domain-containing protein [Nocardioides sp. SYSU D00038]|uniref:DUF3099 domain-containing protein n=1 Tax=Nocardioides sp. SYSU D00038 TaxID=2812554 RepID=UPI0019687CD7|nr:DUF3099 domain-containing protein [Nocardioides sp. SYSU D00038]